MSLDRLWAPWRLDYITTAAATPPNQLPASGCFLCNGIAAHDDRAHLIAHRTQHSVVVLNKYPYNNGHLLVAPLRHKAALADLTAEEAIDLHELQKVMLHHLDLVLRPDGCNIGLNLGRVAGAGLPGHLHWHIVPRWNGDTNFMPVLAQTKVISQSLEALYDLLVQSIGSAR
jgi:ATP adenylyltransferase